MQWKHPIVAILASALLVQHTPALGASAWPDRYNDCLGMEDPNDAQNACEDALTSPALSVLERSEVYRQLGKLNRLEDRLDAAKSDLEASLALVPESPETLAEMGAVLYMEANFEGARELLSKAIAKGVPGASAFNNRGMTLLALGEIKDALRDFNAAVELASDNGAIWNNRANALCASGDVEGAYLDRIQALYNRRFTASQAQAGLRSSGFYDGPADGIWGFDSEQALRAWTEAGCPDAPKSRIQ